MTVRDTSFTAFEQIKENLSPDQQAVYEIILDEGPIHDRRILEALNQKEAATLKPAKDKRKWEINTIPARRGELLGYGVIVDCGAFTGFWYGKKKTYHFWRVRGDERKAPVGWVKVEDESLKSLKSEKGGKSYAMSLSEAARIMGLAAAQRRVKRHIKKEQLCFNFAGNF